MIQTARSLVGLFDIPQADYDITPFGSGHINDTFLLSSPEVPREYVLQRISPAAFRHPDHVMDNIVRVTAFLRASIERRGGDPQREALTVVPLKDGSAFALDGEGNAWRLTLRIPDTVCLDMPDSPESFAESGRAFGMFARDLSEFPARTLHETIPHFHDTPSRLAHFREALKKDVRGRAAQCREVTDMYLQRSSRASSLTDAVTAGKLPLRVTHNDTKFNNVCLSTADHRAVCVIDLDTIMPGLYAYDFGDAIRFGANTALEDERDVDRIRFSLPMYEAFARGYLRESGSIMNETERNSLAEGAWMMTYECGMRFLTDYLEGDVYFHTACEDHNLVRAVNQMTLLRDMERYETQMLRALKD